MNSDINGLIKEDIIDAIDRGRIWLETHFRVCKTFSTFKSKISNFA